MSWAAKRRSTGGARADPATPADDDQPAAKAQKVEPSLRADPPAVEDRDRTD